MARKIAQAKRKREESFGLDELSYEYDLRHGSPAKVRRTNERGPGTSELSSGSELLELPERGARRQRRLDTGATETKQNASNVFISPSDNDSFTAEASDDGVRTSEQYRELSHVNAVAPAYPRSAYEGWRSPLPPVAEHEALSELLEVLQQQHKQSSDPPEHKYITLESFSFYRPSHDARRPSELAGLEKLQVHRGASDGLLFDGVLRAGSTRRFAQGVAVRILTVDGYGDEDLASLNGHICVQSRQAKRHDVWYQLGTPAREYERFFEPFIWLAEFTKHFVDYLLEMDKVTLDDFRFCFLGWLNARHAGKVDYQRWLSACKLQDFRTSICAHLPYLWNECSGIDESLLKHPVWGEVDPYNLKAIPQRPKCEDKTVVTPFAYDMFRRMYFGEFLRERSPSNDRLTRNIRQAKKKLRLAPFAAEAQNSALPTPQSTRSGTPLPVSEVGVGDVVTLHADTEGEWETGSGVWYAYVQGIRLDTSTGRTSLDILWLYEPCDTTLGKAYYPYPNELFLSDNCECGKDAIDVEQVSGKVQVSWNVVDPKNESGLFVRQKFRTADEEGTHDFVSIQPSDFRCRCDAGFSVFEDCRLKYQIGDTVLVRVPDVGSHLDRLDPAQIVDFDLVKRRVILRELSRSSKQHRGAPPNQLVLTETVFDKPPSAVIRKCYTRALESSDVQDGLPIGYDRGGCGDLYFIVREDSGEDVLTGQQTSRTTDGHTLPDIIEGPDLLSIPTGAKMIGMGMFCGGGNFDRGFEDSGCVDFKYAVDWAERALHSYRANAPSPDNVNFFLGSVDDYLAQTLKGSQASFVASPGDIDVLTAGSPCPGFSTLQPDKQSPDSLRNASMVASVVSYVDCFCPKYCILENVVAMTSPMGGKQDQNVFAQVLAAFVALGYQTQQFLVDAWSHGSPQSRSRLFIVASAPGLQPLSLPPHTHDHPKDVAVSLRGLGTASNGRKFGMRRDDYTPFPAVTAAEAVKGLPDIADGQVRICPQFPDHVMPSEEVHTSREHIAAVPVRPYGMGLAQAVHQGLVTGEPADYVHRSSNLRASRNSKAFSRVYPDRLFQTVTTALRLGCGVTGRTLHWNQHRSLTVMELRRTQGFLDHEVIVGSRHQQVEIIGNSVDRKVAFTFGLGLRESWLASSTSGFHRLVDRQGSSMLLSPPATDAEREESTPPSGDNEDAEQDNSEEQVRDDFEASTDLLRAGAAAAAALESSERAMLQPEYDMGVQSSQPVMPMRAGASTVDWILDCHEDGDDGEKLREQIDQRRAGVGEASLPVDRPTAYVEIRRR